MKSARLKKSLPVLAIPCMVFGKSIPTHAAVIEEVIVTAQKREQSLNDLGLAVAVLSGDVLAEKGISSLEDIALAVPGLSFTKSGTDTPVYTLRGVGFYESTLSAYPDVSVYIDESPLPFPVLTNHIAFDIQRLEVLKGPQGTLFGNNATGGALNFIAAKPTEEFEGNVTGGYGRFNRIETQGYISGPMGDNLRGRLAVKSVTADEWQQGYTIDAENGKEDTRALRGILEWMPTEKLTLQTMVNLWYDKGEPQAPQYSMYRANIPNIYTPVEDHPTAPEDNRAADFTDSLGLEKDNALRHFSVRADYSVSESVTFTSISTYIDYDHFLVYDGDGVPQRNFDVPEIIGEINSVSQELRFTGTYQDNFDWVVGGNYSKDEAADDYLLDFSVSTVSVAFPLEGYSGYYSSQEMENWAVFANGEYIVGDFTFKSGVRYTESERTMEGCNYDVPGGGNAQLFESLSNDVIRPALGLPPSPDAAVPPGGCHTLDTVGILGAAPTGLPGKHQAILEEDNVSWKVGADWRVTSNTLLYANITKGYKAGSLPALASSTNEQLKPVEQESLLSYEAGVKARLLDGSMQLNSAIFRYDYKEKQLRSKLNDPIFGVLDTLVNVPETTVKGIEMDVTYRATENLTLFSSLVWLHAEIDDFEGLNGQGEEGDFSGSDVPYTPEKQISVGATYEWSLGNGLVGVIGGDYAYRNETTAVIGGSKAYDIDGYGLLNVRAGVKSEDGTWSVMAWGKNVTDEYYWTNVTSYYDTIARYTGQPVTYGITVSYNF